MHASTPKRGAPRINPESAGRPVLSSAFRSALRTAAGKPPLDPGPLRAADGGPNSGRGTQKDQKINTPLVVRNVTLAPRKGHR